MESHCFNTLFILYTHYIYIACHWLLVVYSLSSHFQAELSQNCPVRFIYQGRIIPDETNVGSLGIAEGGAIHIHIGRPRPQGAPPTNVAPMQQLDLSQYFLPLLGLILGVVWMVMLMYPYVFTFFTKVFLFGLSFGYVVLTYFSTVGARNWIIHITCILYFNSRREKGKKKKPRNILIGKRSFSVFYARETIGTTTYRTSNSIC